MEDVFINIALGVVASAIFSGFIYLWSLIAKKRASLQADEYRSQLKALRQILYFISLEDEYYSELKLNPDHLSRAAIRKRAAIMGGTPHQQLYRSDALRKIASIERKLEKLNSGG